MLKLSKAAIDSFAGDIVTLRAESDGKVTCVSSDENIARVKTIAEGKYLVILENEGAAELNVTAGNESVICRVSVRRAEQSDPDGKFRIFVGDTHAHTSYSDGISDPDTVYAKVRDEDYFRFFTITDHSDLLKAEDFFNTFEAAEQNSTDYFIALPGSESQIDQYTVDSKGDKMQNGGEMVLINKEGFVQADRWGDFLEQAGSNRLGVGILAHPQIPGYDKKRYIWNAFDLEHSVNDRLRSLVHGVEVLNSADASNFLNDRVYTLALDCGLKVAPFGAGDHHGPRWGKCAFPNRTFLYAEKLGKEYILDALLHARAYCCENANVKLFYTVNGKNPASVLEPTDTYEFAIHAEPMYVRRDEDDTDYVEIISDYGEIVASRKVAKFEFDFNMTVQSTSARYFYLKLYSRDGKRTWSCPVWTGREFDEYPKKKFDKKPLDASKFGIKAVSGGENLFSMLDTDTENYYTSDRTDCEFIFDMFSEQTVSAIGYFAPSPQWNNDRLFASFMSRYEYLTSPDGVHYEPAAEGRVLLYGSEHIAEFEPRTARYIKIRAKSSVGSEMINSEYRDEKVTVGCIRVY